MTDTPPAKIEPWMHTVASLLNDRFDMAQGGEYALTDTEIEAIIAAHAPQEPSVPVSNLRGIIGALEFEIHQAEQPKRGKDD